MTARPPETRLNVYSLGFLRERRVRRILELAGYRLALGLPSREGGQVAVWGRRPASRRGARIARARGAGLITVEDAFLRSVLTGRAGAPPLGLVIDDCGIYFDTTRESGLERILNTGDLADAALLDEARAAMARIKAADLSKYNAFDPGLAPPGRDYVLVIDQTRNDASIRLGGADAARFAEMLAAARAENPGREILIKTHPEVATRHRRGHFSAGDQDGRTRLVTAPISPRRLIEGAAEIYCVTSLMGFEAICMGRRPHLFGRPFYGGWGLSEDRLKFARRERSLSRAQLFAGAMIRYPTWYDPYRDRLCDLACVIDTLEAQARAWREDCAGYAALGVRAWKRAPLTRFLSGAGRRLGFESDVRRAARSGRRGLVWASRETPALRQAFADSGQALLRIEDGFLRSRGLGAELVPPLSLVIDRRGIYYDPTRESDLERLIARSGALDKAALERAARLRARLIGMRLSKYNLGAAGVGARPEGAGRRILVPGQVEDDASIRLGAGELRTNIALLARCRAENPEAFIAYKPHPDVEAGLREGRVSREAALCHADAIWDGVDAVAAIEAVDEIWTLTSLLGFEALLREKPVTCLGAPFYAGWGLTRDLGPVPARRRARPGLDALVHAALIAYPRYHDPLSGQAAPVEVIVERLASGQGLPRSAPNRMLAKLQGRFARFAPLWR